MKYRYEVDGTAAEGQTWAVNGEIDCDKPGLFMAAINEAMRRSFQALTEGKAVYGQPGVGCIGPYRVTRFLIEDET